VPQLVRLREGRLDRVWLTHGDSDHWGGLADLLASPVRVDTLVLPAGAQFPDEFWSALTQSGRRPAVIRQGAPWQRRLPGGLRVRLLHPFTGAPASAAASGKRNPNDDSFVLLFEQELLPDRPGSFPTHPTFRLLLVGDLERAREAAVLESLHGAPIGPVSVAQLGHHGSRGAGSDEWWQATSPILAVISVGAGNTYGLPHPLTLQAARAHQARILRTDQSGMIRIGLDGGRRVIFRDKGG
jgi:competence protein ComEC